MIIDYTAAAAAYRTLGPRMAEALDYLASHDIGALADGRYEINGDDIFMTVTRSPLRSEDAAPLEAHDRYIDIQLLIEGSERYGWQSRALCTAPRGSFDTGRDIVFFDDRPGLYFTLVPGMLAIFLPGDAHAPLIGRGEVRKCIVKVRA
ncbi:MAG: YhcH/YjgK/YiaL family protein [Rikenellaceae bacterium]|nr:YhcH/YjgK/YiaL family protein [Rikenellaceae bacterium]